MAQLGTISQDPWFSKHDTPHAADYVALDLDPMPGVPFSQVLDVARWVRDELERLGVPGVPKTSGSSGLHVYIPLPEGTPYEAGQLLCQILATIVAHKHRKEATVERTVGKRGRTVYVDYLQNILGKTLATAYSARASEFAGVSTPLTWDEIDEGVSPGDFTIKTAPARFAAMPDLWKPVIAGPPVDLHGVLERLARDPEPLISGTSRAGSSRRRGPWGSAPRSRHAGTDAQALGPLQRLSHERGRLVARPGGDRHQILDTIELDPAIGQLLVDQNLGPLDIERRVEQGLVLVVEAHGPGRLVLHAMGHTTGSGNLVTVIRLFWFVTVLLCGG